MKAATENACVLVCVTNQPSNERLIRAGSAIAKMNGIALHVLSVLPKGGISDGMAEFMQELYDIVGAIGAQITFIFNGDPALTAAVHAAKINAVHIVTGTPDAGSSMFLETVKELMPHIPISIVDADNRLYTIPSIPAHPVFALKN